MSQKENSKQFLPKWMAYMMNGDVRSCLPVIGLVVMLSGSGCSGNDIQYKASIDIAFDDLFHEVRRITIEEPVDFPITGIRRLDVFSDRRIALVDELGGQVRVHGPDGAFLGFVGRTGMGPGELQGPIDIAIDPMDGLYVADTRGPLIQRFDSSLMFDTSFSVGDGYFPFQVEIVDGGVLTGLRSGLGAPYRVWTPEGAPRNSFNEWPERILDEPYWRSVARDHATVCADRVVVATNLIYPLREYDLGGEQIGELGAIPKSWLKVPSLQPGELAGPDQNSKLIDWLSRFTVVDAVHCYRNSQLVVVHGRFSSSLTARMSDIFNVEHYALDLYMIGDTTQKLAEDVAVPGRVLYSGEQLYLLLSSPPDRWTIGIYELLEREH